MMSYKEAISILSVYYEPGDIRQNDALDLAIESLEKQIPTKPEYISGGYADGFLVWVACCPTCGHWLEVEDEEYCQNCGQKIDWSEKE